MKRKMRSIDRYLVPLAGGAIAAAALAILFLFGAPRPTVAGPAGQTYLPIVLNNARIGWEQSTQRMGVWLGTLSGPLDPVVSNRLASTGATWTRAYLDWNSVPLRPDGVTYDFTGFDPKLQAFRNLGVRAIVDVRGNPARFATTACGPIDKLGGLDAFESFMRQAVAHFDDYGVHHWEMYNEADNRDVAFGESGGIGCWGGHPEAYVFMLQRAYAAVHQTDPAGKVLLGGLAFDCYPKCDATNKYNLQFLDEILVHGAAPYFDIANVHAFSSQNQTPRPNSGLVSEFWGRGFDIVGKIETLRAVMSARGVSKPVVVTELSWTNNADLELQARYVPKVLARGLAADVLIMNWFCLTEINNSWDDPGQVAYGLAGPAGSGYAPRPSLTAFAIAAREFGDNASVRRLSPGEVRALAGVEGYAFTMPDGRQRWVLWARFDGQPDGGSASIPITVPATTVAAYNKLGDAIALLPGSSYSLSDDPIYLRLQ